MTPEQKQEQIERIESYTKIVQTIAESDSDLLTFAVEEILDRVRLYLNRDDVPVLVERPLAKTVGSIFNKYKNTNAIDSDDREISSMSDNGQSISYSNSIKQYLTTSSDEELFTGVESLLKRYRRLNFVGNTEV